MLAPGMDAIQPATLANQLHPYTLIPWKGIDGFIFPILRDNQPDLILSNLPRWIARSTMSHSSFYSGKYIAPVAHAAFPDTSRLSLVACGDVKPDPYRSLESTSDAPLDYRGNFLSEIVKPQDFLSAKVTHKNPDGSTIAPDRFALSHLVDEPNRFPLAGAVNILQVCAMLRGHLNDQYHSFINLTAIYKGLPSYTQRRHIRTPDYPTQVIIVSEHFGLQEAMLYWNTRAQDVVVAWLSFADLEVSLRDVAGWLNRYRRMFVVIGQRNVVFTSFDDTKRLQTIIDAMQPYNQDPHQIWSVKSPEQVMIYKYTRPYVMEERAAVLRQGARCTIQSPFAEEASAIDYTYTIELSDLMLPQSAAVIKALVSNQSIGLADGSDRGLRYKATHDRYLRSSCLSANSPIEINIPAASQVIVGLFTEAGYSRIETSSAARFHQVFVQRAGSLAQAAYYLATEPYWSLLRLLADNTSKRAEWILEHEQRRAIHHWHLLNLLAIDIPPETKRYFDTKSDELPNEVVELLDKGLLERGFKLVCRICSHTAWYPVQHIGQEFECARCFKRQVYTSNPLWLYKLPEVIFVGLNAHNMHVPLLALHYLQRQSNHNFDWMPDSDVYPQAGKSQNVDLLCLVDGKLYIGEAKSSDEIEAEQFRSYAQLCQRLPVDGVVFATSQPRWKPGTMSRIDQLRTEFTGDVLVLTATELYPGVTQIPSSL